MSRGNMWRLVGWGLAVAVILTPLVAMQLNAPGVNWTIGDFIFAGVLIGGVGGLFELAVRSSASWAYRGGVALALAAAFLTIWINGAVGIIGDEGGGANLVFHVVVLLAITGAIVAGGKARLMSRAMMVPAVAQLLIAIYVAATGIGANDPPGQPGLSFLIGGFGVIWLGSALLFRHAAAQQ